MRFAVRASSLLPWALCLGGVATFGCQSQLLTLGSRPVENEAGTAGAAFGGTPSETSGGAGAAGGAPGGQGGDAAGGIAGSDAGGEAGSNAGGEAGAGGSGDAAGASGSGGSGIIRIIDVSPIAELSDDEDDDDNPTLTADLLHIYFLSSRGDGADVWTASRSSPTGLFGTPVLVDAINTDEPEASPAISLDGLTLWVGQERDGGLGGDDIWSVTRSSMGSAWSAPENVTALNSSADDIPRQPGFLGLVMPLGSRRGLDGLFHTYFATRSSTGDAFGTPELLSELVFAERSTVDGFLTADGLLLFYASSTNEDASDLYVVRRPSVDEPFGEPMPLIDVNNPDNDERDPWVSPDGTTLYFAAYNDGDRDLFTAQIIWE